MPKMLIMGLGNPGEEYTHSPHNAGYEVIDILYKKIGENKQIQLEKTGQFMNRSGNAVKKLLALEKLGPEESLWIIHDDIDLPLGTIRKSRNRGPGGHKGVENIMKVLGTRNFYRYRIGTQTSTMKFGNRKDKMQKFVTTPYRGNNAKKFQTALKDCAKMIIEDLK